MQLRWLSQLVVVAALGGCAAPIYYVEDENEPEVYAPDPPPDTRTEAIPPPPGRYYVWLPGRWAWAKDTHRYMWRPGVYRRIRHPQHRAWVSGHWESTARGYVWLPGHWR